MNHRNENHKSVKLGLVLYKYPIVTDSESYKKAKKERGGFGIS